MNTAVEEGLSAAWLMQRVTVCQGPARSGTWPECGCRPAAAAAAAAAAAGCRGPGRVPPDSDCPEAAGSGPRSPALAEGPRCSLAPVREAAGRGR